MRAAWRVHAASWACADLGAVLEAAGVHRGRLQHHRAKRHTEDTARAAQKPRSVHEEGAHARNVARKEYTFIHTLLCEPSTPNMGARGSRTELALQTAPGSRRAGSVGSLPCGAGKCVLL